MCALLALNRSFKPSEIVHTQCPFLLPLLVWCTKVSEYCGSLLCLCSVRLSLFSLFLPFFSLSLVFSLSQCEFICGLLACLCCAYYCLCPYQWTWWYCMADSPRCITTYSSTHLCCVVVSLPQSLPLSALYSRTSAVLTVCRIMNQYKH